MTLELRDGDLGGPAHAAALRASADPTATSTDDARRRTRRPGGVADRVASFLERRVDRRGVLRRGAMAGTALAVAPTTFVLRPGSAYAAVCSPGALCNDGYTEFCCTLSGANRCPPGTALGGWWKVDGSHFCGGGPRYYMDCHPSCGGCGCGGNGICSGACSGTGCGCANGDCNNRKSGCTAFRYGQCNQATRCLGPIVCRIVSCTEPWRLDGSCTTAVRTDNATRYHTRPCLEVDAVGNLESVEAVPGGVRVRGWALDPDTAAPVSVVLYDCNRPVATITANLDRPDVAAAFPGLGAAHGFDFFLRPCPGTRLISAAAVDTTGQGSTWIGHSIVDVAPNAWGHLDSVVAAPGEVRLGGWVVDPWGTGPMTVHVFVDGVPLAAVPANVHRPDVARVHPHLDGHHGFEVSLPQLPGSHTVCAIARNDARGEVLDLGCRPVVVPAVSAGAVDAALSTGPGAVRVQGWVAGADAVQVAVDGEVVATVPADAERDAGGAAFDAGLTGVAPGEHDVTVTAIGGADDGAELSSSTVAVASTAVGRVTALEAVPGGVRVATTPVHRTDGTPSPVRVLVDGRFRASLGSGATGVDEVLSLPSGVHEVAVVSSIEGRGTIPVQLATARVVVP